MPRLAFSGLGRLRLVAGQLRVVIDRGIGVLLAPAHARMAAVCRRRTGKTAAEPGQLPDRDTSLRPRARAVPWTAVLVALMVRSASGVDLSTADEAYGKGDYEAAFVQWRLLADRGDPRAQYQVARMLADGVGVREDDEAARLWYRRAAEQDSVEARSALALMHLLGQGGPRDESRAAHWYTSLAEDGHAPAQMLLAGMYEDGRGVARDPHRAAYWYRQSAERGHVGAQVKLGMMYSRGHGVDEDRVRAWAWLDLAAARGDEGAVRELANLRGRLGNEEFAEAMRLRRELDPSDIVVSAIVPPPDDEPALDLVRGPEMFRVRSECFTMGSDPAEAGRHENERRHVVCLENFSIARHEVTRGQYATFVDETGRRTPDDCRTYGAGGWVSRAGRSWRAPGYAQSDDHPVVCVSRRDAAAYAAWLSEHLGDRYRLPTEAEWEYAARALEDAARHWGEDSGRACHWANVGDRALHRHYREWPWTIHTCDDGYVHTAPVGRFRANRYGLHDMLGNVWEWTCSSYDPDYRGAERRCAPNGHGGVVRGGSWSNSPRWARSAGRFESQADARFDLVGFRLAHD